MPKGAKSKQPEPDPVVTSKGVPLRNRWKGNGLLEHYHKIGPSALCAATMFGNGKSRTSAAKKS